MNPFNRYANLKKKIGGCREKSRYEFTMRPDPAELNNITGPSPHIRRILAELGFALQLMKYAKADCGGEIDAALEILETGAEEVAIEPQDQLGDIARYLPKMAKVNFRGTWIYSEDFKDEWTSNRLRWQFWTFRYE